MITAPNNIIGIRSLQLLIFALIAPAFGLGGASPNGKSASSCRPPPPPIIACKSTSEVQRAIDIYIRPGDVALELGAQLADTSAHLCRAVGVDGRAVLVDVKRKEASSGRSIGRDASRFVNADDDHGRDVTKSASSDNEVFVDRSEYHELDQFDEWRELVSGGQQYNIMILDVSSTIGNDLHLSAISLANEFVATQTNCRAIVMKSKLLAQLSKRLVHSQRLLDGTVSLPPTDKLVRRPDPIIIPSVGVNDYRKTIPYVVERGDDVIEVGCHFGTTTALLLDAATAGVTGEENGVPGFVAGVDIGRKIIQNARTRYPGMTFEVADAWDTLHLLQVKQSRKLDSSSLGYDVVYADIGGLSGANGLLESMALLDALGRALEPRCIVIKSLCMKRLASHLFHVSSVTKKMNAH